SGLVPTPESRASAWRPTRSPAVFLSRPTRSACFLSVAISCRLAAISGWSTSPISGNRLSRLRGTVGWLRATTPLKMLKRMPQIEAELPLGQDRLSLNGHRFLPVGNERLRSPRGRTYVAAGFSFRSEQDR